MFKINLVLLCATLLPVLSSAQNNYKEGYVVTNAGDTLKGFISYGEWYYNPDKINFKPATGNTTMTVTPADAKEITVTGFGTYKRFNIRISMRSLEFERITETENDSAISKTVFLHQLQHGNFVSLYAYTDKVKMRFYVLESGKSIPEELVYEKKIELMQEQTFHTFRQQLFQYAATYNGASEKLQHKIEYLQYDENSLKQIIRSINTNNERTVQPRSINARATSYFAGIGIMQAALKYTGADLITADGVDANSVNKYKDVTTKNITPRIAAGINFYSKRWAHRLGIKAEVSAFRFMSTITSYTKYSNLSDAENHYTFNLSGWSINITPHLIYKFYSSRAVKAYVGAGPGFNILTAGKNSIYTVGINQPLSFNETTDDYFPLNWFNMTLTGRAGILLADKVDIYVCGSTPMQYSRGNAKDFSVKSGVLAFCAAYNF